MDERLLKMDLEILKHKETLENMPIDMIKSETESVKKEALHLETVLSKVHNDLADIFENKNAENIMAQFEKLKESAKKTSDAVDECDRTVKKFQIFSTLDPKEIIQTVKVRRPASAITKSVNQQPRTTMNFKHRKVSSRGVPALAFLPTANNMHPSPNTIR